MYGSHDDLIRLPFLSGGSAIQVILWIIKQINAKYPKCHA